MFFIRILIVIFALPALDLLAAESGTEITSLLKKHCFRCHGDKVQEGNLRIDRLDRDLIQGSDADRWHEVLNRLNTGEMPPEDEPRMTDDELAVLTGWLTQALNRAAKARRATDGQVVFRRLNRQEYNNTLNDLFGIDLEITHLLPPERPSNDGFTNNGRELVMSPLHFESFVKIARLYLNKALIDSPRERPPRQGFFFNLERHTNGKPKATGYSLADVSKPANFRVETYPNVDPKKPRRGPFTGEIREHSIVLPPARRATGTQIPARRGPQPRITIPLREFPDSGVVRVRVRARTLPGRSGDAAPVTVGVYPLLPDCDLDSFAGQLPTQTLHSPAFDLRSLGIQIEKVSLKFSTHIQIPTTGEYQFFTKADDGARLYIDGKQVVNGETVNQERNNRVRLEAGLHELIVTYFDTGGGESLSVDWEGPNIQKQPIPPNVLVDPTPEKKREKPKQQSAYLAVMMANLLDDGVEFEPIGETVAVTATEAPEIYEFVGRMENLPLPFRQRSGQTGELNNAWLFLVNQWEPASPFGPQLEIHSVEFEAPFYPQWPPKSHTAIVTSDDPRSLVTHFLTRAFRRPVKDDEVERLITLWKQFAEENPEATYVETAREVLTAALIHPSFLYLVEPDEGEPFKPRALDDHELANRLAYFLTRTMPDQELRRLADKGTLHQPAVLRQQTRRLLADPRSNRFIAGFIDQWLDLEALERIPVDRKRHATYQPWLRDSMRKETRGLFATVLRENRSALELIDADYLYLDPILAVHYSVGGVTGAGFRKVPVPEGSPRGGMLTHAAFLTGNSNGVDSHPIKRGVWLLDRLLNDPPPPPPPNVPDLNAEAPQFKGKTLKEQLAIHRDVQACRNCHQKIDPFGIPLENFNTVGQWRNSGDTSSTLPDGTTIDGVQQLKQYLLTERKDDFAEALTRKLLSWALGRSLNFADNQDVAGLTERFRESEYRITPLIESIVTSKLFTHR